MAVKCCSSKSVIKATQITEPTRCAFDFILTYQYTIRHFLLNHNRILVRHITSLPEKSTTELILSSWSQQLIHMISMYSILVYYADCTTLFAFSEFILMYLYNLYMNLYNINLITLAVQNFRQFDIFSALSVPNTAVHTVKIPADHEQNDSSKHVEEFIKNKIQ